MTGTIELSQPSTCSGRQLAEFARLVRAGFPGARDLECRIGAARWLAFCAAPDGSFAAVAALKAPDLEYRAGIFEQAGAPASAADYVLDLGWVFVAPEHRRQGIAGDLCHRLLAREREANVFSTTRTDNAVMRHILGALGFEQVGRPYPRGEAELALFLRRST